MDIHLFITSVKIDELRFNKAYQSTYFMLNLNLNGN